WRGVRYAARRGGRRTGEGGHAVKAQALAAKHAKPPVAAGAKDHVITVTGSTLIADPAGVLYWPEEGLLVVADLHLEKGSAFAKRGVLLPPYDTATTLARLARLVERYAPRLVVALGDNFHDDHGSLRMSS